jgi:hypothetical protein
MKTQEAKSKTTTAAPVQRRRANDPERKINSDEANLPIAHETEKEVLGLFLFEPEAIQKALEAGLTDSLFWVPSHKLIFSAMKHVQDKGWTLSYQTLRDYLTGQHSLDKVGGDAYLAALLHGRPYGSERLSGLIQQLKDIEYKRQVVRKSAELQRGIAGGDRGSNREHPAHAYDRPAIQPHADGVDLQKAGAVRVRIRE